MKIAIPGDYSVVKWCQAHFMGYYLIDAYAVSNFKRLLLLLRILHENGAFIMIDNGAAEMSKVEHGKALEEGGVAPTGVNIPFAQVVRWAGRCNADEIMLPDKKMDSDWTIEHTLESAGMVPPKMRAIVPQGKSLQDWIDCWTLIDSGLNGQYATICVTKDFEELWGGGRAHILSWIQDRELMETYHIHLLGAKGPNYREEFLRLSQFTWVRGIDTSVPVAYAQESPAVSMDEIDERISYRHGERFHAPTVHHNLMVMKEWLNAHNSEE